MRHLRPIDAEHVTVPGIGERIERTRAGVTQRGTVHYSDDLQALVKWDDGSSSSLRLDRARFRIVEAGRPERAA